MEVVSQLLSISVMKPGDIRFFLGYSGWSRDQLDNELKNNSWLVGNIQPRQIIHPSRNLWQESVKSMGESYQHWMSFPKNPGYN
jgi:putative transcriptional regulator